MNIVSHVAAHLSSQELEVGIASSGRGDSKGKVESKWKWI